MTAASCTSSASVLASNAKLRKQIKDELLADAKKFGDARRSQLVQREAAQAINQAELIPSEPVPVVLSAKGWIRAAKGHDVDASALGYREGDKLLQAVRGIGGRRQELLVERFDAARPVDRVVQVRGNERGQLAQEVRERRLPESVEVVRDRLGRHARMTRPIPRRYAESVVQ